VLALGHRLWTAADVLPPASVPLVPVVLTNARSGPSLISEGTLSTCALSPFRPSLPQQENRERIVTREPLVCRLGSQTDGTIVGDRDPGAMVKNCFYIDLEAE